MKRLIVICLIAAMIFTSFGNVYAADTVNIGDLLKNTEKWNVGEGSEIKDGVLNMGMRGKSVGYSDIIVAESIMFGGNINIILPDSTFTVVVRGDVSGVGPWSVNNGYYLSVDKTGITLGKIKERAYTKLAGSTEVAVASPSAVHNFEIVTKNISNSKVQLAVLIDGLEILRCEDKENPVTENGYLSFTAMEGSTANLKAYEKIATSTIIATTEQKELVKALGIVADEELSSMNAKITRAQFVTIVMRLLGIEDDVKAANVVDYYSDVNTENASAADIAVATALGIVNGVGNRKFLPDDNVQLSEAVKMLVCALGYTPVAEENGGYMSGYLSVAAQKGLLKGYTGEWSTACTLNNLIPLIYNSLNVKMLLVDGAHKHGRYYESDETILSKYLELDTYSGTITANEETSLTSASDKRREMIRINETWFETDGADYNNLLGYSVKAYVKDVKDGEFSVIKYIEVDRRNTEEKYDADRLIVSNGNYGLSSIVFWNEDDKKSEYEIAKNADFIYNGAAYPNMKDDDLKITNGFIRIVDNNSDGLADVVFVEEYVTDVIESVDRTYKTIFLKFGEKLEDLEFDKNTCKFIKEGGRLTDIRQVKKGDVLSIAKAKDGKSMIVYVSSRFVLGAIEEIYEDYLVIAGRSYKIGELVEDYDFELGLTAKFYTDYNGKIVYAENFTKTGMKYGVLVGVAKPTDTLSSKMRFKIFTEDGVFSEFQSGDKLKINKLNRQSAEAAVAAAGLENPARQLIKYSVNNNGEITRILTSVDSIGKIPEYDCDVLQKNYVTKSGIFRLVNYSLDSKIFVNENTKIFTIPNPDDTEYREEDFGVYTYGYFDGSQEDEQYECYDMTDKQIVGAMTVVSKGGAGTIKFNKSVLLVKSVSKGINADGVEVPVINGYVEGAEVSVPALDGSLTDKTMWTQQGRSITDLKFGDVIAYSKTSDGLLKEFAVVLSAEKENGGFKPQYFEKYYASALSPNVLMYNNGKLIRSYYNGTAYAELEHSPAAFENDAAQNRMNNTYGRLFYSGIVLKKFGSNFIVDTFNFGRNFNWNRNIEKGGYAVMVADSKTNKIYASSYDEIREGDIILQTLNSSMAETVIIYR